MGVERSHVRVTHGYGQPGNRFFLRHAEGAWTRATFRLTEVRESARVCERAAGKCAVRVVRAPVRCWAAAAVPARPSRGDVRPLRR